MIDNNKLFSTELFGFTNKKSVDNYEDSVSINDLSKYKPEIIEKCHSMLKNAWNYKAYKLPTSMGNINPEYKNYYTDEEVESRREECGFNNRIGEEENSFSHNEKISSGKLIVFGEGIFDFAWGQPTEFENYNKTLIDISERWSSRLKAKENEVLKYLSQFYNDCSIETKVDTGDGDEGCVYPEYKISIPISELR